MSYQFIFINGQPDVQQIQQMATTLAPREGQETTTTSSAPQVHQIALPAPGASSLRIRPPNLGPRPQTAPPGICPLCQHHQEIKSPHTVPLQVHRCKLRIFPILVSSQVRNVLLGTHFQSTNTGPRPSMSPQEQQRKRLKESNPTTLPPGNWRQEFGVYDPYSRNIETTETSEDESRHAPPTDNEAPFNAFGAAAPRNVPDTTGPRNVPDTAAVSLTSEQTEIRAWFRAHQDRVCQLDDGFIRWLSRLLDQNQITPAEMGPLRMLTYRYQDYAQHGSVDTREEVFYVLPLPHFRKTAQIPQSEPPAPRRAFPGHPTIEHVTLVHATTVGGLKGIFNSGKISPSILHDPDSMSFFALGARRTGDPKWDSQELTRILHNGWHASKNACNVLLVAVGWGTGENIDVGGEHPCIQKTKDGGIVHHRRAKLWVCHTDSHLIHGIAFCSTATDPEAPF